MTKNFNSYAHQDLPIKKIKKYAEQYRDIDMWALHGVDEDSFPFLVWKSDDDYPSSKSVGYYYLCPRLLSQGFDHK